MLVKKMVKGERIIYRKAGFLDWFQKNETEICVVFGAVTVIACTVLSLFLE